MARPVTALPKKGHPSLGQVVGQPMPTQPPTQATTVKTDATWDCRLTETSDLTVGKKFTLSCEGPPMQLHRESLHLVLPKDIPFALRILEVKELGETKAEFVVTSWTPGDYKLQNPILTDGEHSISLGKMNYTVASVITKENNPEQKPFPPWAPSTLAWPIYVWVIIACFLAAVACAVALLIRRSMQRRRFRAALAANQIAISPFNHLNKELRVLTRALPANPEDFKALAATRYIDDLDNAIRWYFARELTVPVLQGGAKNAAKEVMHAAPKLFDKNETLARDLVICLSEIAKAKRDPAKLQMNDAQQLLELARSLTDRINAGLHHKEGA